METESDHSDVESDSYQDFVNISLDVAEIEGKVSATSATPVTDFYNAF